MSGLLVDDLRQEIANRQVIAIVGAGVSIGATNNNPVASWVGLLRSGVERCAAVVPNLDKGWANGLRSKIESTNVDDLLSAAEKIQKKLTSHGGEFSRWLKGDHRRPESRTPRCHYRIAGPGSPDCHDQLRFVDRGGDGPASGDVAPAK
jgi:hypothetical protein